MRAGLAERDGPGAGVAVGVAGVGQDVAEEEAAAGMRVRTFANARTGSGSQLVRVIRRASSGTAGPVSSRVMVAADR